VPRSPGSKTDWFPLGRGSGYETGSGSETGSASKTGSETETGS
jgi:hypothetical protein